MMHSEMRKRQNKLLEMFVLFFIFQSSVQNWGQKNVNFPLLLLHYIIH